MNLDFKITEHEGKIYLITRDDPIAKEFATKEEAYQFLKPKILSRYKEELLLLKRLLSEI